MQLLILTLRRRGGLCFHGLDTDSFQDKRKQAIVEFNKAKFGIEREAAAWPLPKLLYESGIEFPGPWLEDPRTDFVSNRYRKNPAYAIGSPLDTHRQLADAIESGIYAWVDDYCVDSADVLESLSSQEKEHLIKGLNNYCLQDNWSSLVSQLGPHSFAYENLPKILAGAILAKSIWEDVVKDPFFFLGENCAPVSPDIHPDLFLPSRSQIHNMWRWCEEGKYLSLSTLSEKLTCADFSLSELVRCLQVAAINSSSSHRRPRLLEL